MHEAGFVHAYDVLASAGDVKQRRGCVHVGYPRQGGDETRESERVLGVVRVDDGLVVLRT